MTSATWLKERLMTLVPTREMVIRSTRHIPNPIAQNLFSSDELKKGNALGYLYESVVYEATVSLSQQSKTIGHIVRWRDDVPPKFRSLTPDLGQNGLYYTSAGEISVRGNGQELAEIDLLVFDNEDRAVFAEITSSKQDLGKLESEVYYKKQLLRFLFDDFIEFLLISPIDLSKSPKIKRLLGRNGNYHAVISGLGSILSRVTQMDLIFERRPNNSPNLIFLGHVKTAGNLDYLRLHNQARVDLVNAVRLNKNHSGLQRGIDQPPLVKNVLLGAFDRDAIVQLLREKWLILNGNRLTVQEFLNGFSKVVLALKLPELRPVLYFRLKVGHAYLKFGPKSMTEFCFERNITRSHAYAFFQWLEIIPLSLGSQFAKQTLDFYLREEVAHSRKKKGAKPMWVPRI